MCNLNKESSDTMKHVNKRWAAWLASKNSDTHYRPTADRFADAYDALDERLMATFPASDAVAQY